MNCISLRLPLVSYTQQTSFTSTSANDHLDMVRFHEDLINLAHPSFHCASDAGHSAPVTASRKRENAPIAIHLPTASSTNQKI